MNPEGILTGGLGRRERFIKPPSLARVRCVNATEPGYRVHLHDATVIDLHAEAMWPRSNALDFTITTPVIGLPRTVVVQRCARADVDPVVRDDLATWPPLAELTSVAPALGLLD